MDLFTTYILPIMGFFLLMALYILFTTKKKPKELKQKAGMEQLLDKAMELANSGEVPSAEVKEEPIEVRLYDSITRSVYDTTLLGEVVRDIKGLYKSPGRMWNKNGKWLYAINKYSIANAEEPKYRPVEVLMSATRSNPPSKVHRALMQQEVGIVYDVREEKSIMQKLVPILVFCGAMIMVMFMWSQS